MNQQQFQLAANISAELAARWFPHINIAIEQFGVSTLEDTAMFIAQVGHESNGFSTLIENLNYSVSGLKKMFGHRLTDYQCEMLGRVTGKQIAYQPQIANIVYGGRNGNRAPDDGWKFRGRGLLQITGRNNYAKCGVALGIDLLATPELLEQEHFAAKSAAWFFTTRGGVLYTGDIVRVTKLINGGLNGLDDRRKRYATACAALV